MKNVLLTTTALVAFAGAATAASHAGGPTIDLTGSAEIKYNDPDNGVDAARLSYGADLTVTATAQLNNGITAMLTYGIALDNADTSPGTNLSLVGDTYPTISLESSYGKLTYGKDADFANDHYSDVDGMDFGFNDKGDFEDDFGFGDMAGIRFDGNYGGIDFSVSGVDTSGLIGLNPVDFLQVGVSGTVGNFAFGFAYDDSQGAYGLNVGTTFGAFSVDFAYMDTGTFQATPVLDGGLAMIGHGQSIGIAVGYDINSMINVGAYVARNEFTLGGDDMHYGVSLDYANGPLTVAVSFDANDFGGVNTSNAAIDVTYDLGGTSAGLVAYAGYDQADGGYVGVVYDLGGGAEAWVSYSEFDESGDPEFDDGITVGVSMTF